MTTKFLFVSWEGLIGDIAWQVVKEGHEAKLWIQNAEERGIAELRAEDRRLAARGRLGRRGGVRRRARRWRSPRGLRGRGKPVVGGSPYTDRLEDDRAFGQQELKSVGVSIIPHENFTSFDEAVKYVEEIPTATSSSRAARRRTSSGCSSERRTTAATSSRCCRTTSARVVGQGQGVPAAAPHHGRRSRGRRILQREEFVTPVCVNFEHKKLFPGDIGRPPARWAPRCSGASRTGCSTPR